MKKSLLAAAALAAVSGVAQADVQLYGVLDVAIGSINHSANADPNFPSTIVPGYSSSAVTTTLPSVGTVTGMFNGGIQDSRWGIKGSEDIGNGMKAFFTLEQGFNVNSGAVNNAAASLASNSGSAATNHFTTGANSALNGQMFNRGAFVGLSKDGLGTISFGRQTAFVWDDETKFDPVFDAQLFSPLGNSGTYGGGVGSSDSSRWDNSVKYKNTYGDFNYGAMYKFGGVAGSTSNGQAYGFTAGYDKGPLALQFSYQSETDAPVSGIDTVANGTVAVTTYNAKGWQLSGKYAITSDLTAKAGYEMYTLGAASDAFAMSSYVGYTVSATSTATGAYVGADKTTHVFFVGGDYNVTPAFNVSVGFYDIENDAVVAKGTNATGTAIASTAVAANSMKEYSILADYHFSKRTDVYAGALSTNFSGFGSTVFTNNALYAVGIRHKF